MEDFYMLKRTNWLSLLLLPLFGIFTLNIAIADSNGKVSLYTPYTKISVPPGESLTYTVDVINNTTEVANVDLAVTGIPSSWSYAIKSGGYTVSQISVLPGEKKNFTLTVDVPMKVNKGTYRFNVTSGGYGILPLIVIVSEQGTFTTEFNAKHTNLQGSSTSAFTFNADLRNRTAEKQLYALRASAPRGWTVTFKSSEYKQVTSVNVEPNQTESITIDIKAPDRTETGTYKVPVSAVTSTTSAEIELEVVITGSYGIELTTPSGLLSTTITAGDQKRIELLVKNTGSSELSEISLTASAPVNWDVIFDPAKIDKLRAGANEQVFATIKADKKAIAGDYVTNIDIKTPEVSSKLSFRISVKTPMLYGWIGVLIIVLALGSVYYLFRKYGRR